MIPSFLTVLATWNVIRAHFVLCWEKVASISLLVGGGCDDRTEYVELLADGVGVARATGKCAEDMRSVRWDNEEDVFGRGSVCGCNQGGTQNIVMLRRLYRSVCAVHIPPRMSRNRR